MAMPHVGKHKIASLYSNLNLCFILTGLATDSWEQDRGMYSDQKKLSNCQIWTLKQGCV